MTATVEHAGGLLKGRGMGRNKSASDQSTYGGRLGIAICARREALALTVERFQVRLAGKGCRVSTQTIYAWEAGTRPIPLNDVPAIAHALNTKPRRLLPEA